MSVWEIRKCSVCHQPGVSRFVWRNAGWRVRIVGPDEDETGRSRWASWWEEGWLQCLTSSMPATISFVLLRIFLILLNSEKEVIKWTVWNTSLPALQKKKKINKNIQTETVEYFLTRWTFWQTWLQPCMRGSLRASHETLRKSALSQWTLIYIEI